MNSSSVDVMGASTTKTYLQKCVATLGDEEEWRKDSPREGEEVGCLSEWTTQWKGQFQPRRFAHEHLKEPTSLQETLRVLVLPLCEKRTGSNCKCIPEVTRPTMMLAESRDNMIDDQTKEGPSVEDKTKKASY